MRIFPAGIDGVLIIGNVSRRKSPQVLATQQIAIHHLYGIGIEMNVVAHLIERDMQGVVRRTSVHYSILQQQHFSLHAQRAHLFIKDMRVRLRKKPQRQGAKDKYICYFLHLRLQKYKKNAKLQNIFTKNLHNSKKCSTFAPAFRKNYSPHGSLGTQTSGAFEDRRAEAQVVRLFSGAV